MSTAPTFFVPGAAAGADEDTLTDLARFAHRPVPKLHERIYSITFTHNGEEWTATVGEALHGVRYDRNRKKGGLGAPRVHHFSDAAVVRAIFPGNPYVVVTDHPSHPNARSAWENPFFAGIPSAIKKFSQG